MSIYKTINIGNSDLIIWKITESVETLMEISDCTPPVNISNQTRIKEFLAVRCSVKSLGADPSDIRYLPSGKPYLNNSDKKISISHTKCYAAVIIGTENMIAVDIEARSERILKIRRKFMNDHEETNLKSSGFDEVTGLLIHWCAKESLFKAIPDENIDFSEELIVCNLNNTGNTGKFEAAFTRNHSRFELEYFLEEDFIMTYCLKK
jgi:phosphopantetheinyl transferase